jgi:hypothetical protein
MKKAVLLIALVLVVLMVAGSGLAAVKHPGNGGHGSFIKQPGNSGHPGHGGHLGHGGHGHGARGHGGYGHGGFGFYGGGYGVGIAAPVYVGVYPAACAIRCYNQIVPSCSSTIEGGQVCSNAVVRSCSRYCY